MSVLNSVSENIEHYLKQHRLPEVFESLLTALAVYQPASVEEFMIEKIYELKENPCKFEQLAWDSFIERKKRPEHRPYHTDFFWSLNYTFFQNDFSLTAKACSFYNQNLVRKCYRSFHSYWKSAVYKKLVLKQNLDGAHSYYISNLFRKYLHCWEAWMQSIKEKHLKIQDVMKRCFEATLQKCVLKAWFQLSMEIRMTREYFERKKDLYFLSGKDGILRDPMCLLPEKAAVNIFRFVDLRSLLNCAMVCQKWKEITQSKVLWSKIDVANSEKDSISNKVLMNLIQKCRPILCQLNFRKCQLLSADVLESIGGCCNLQDLNISYCPSVNDNVLKEISYGCTSLLYINVSHTKVTDSSLHYFARFCNSIRYLDISHCKNISDVGLYYLANGKFTQKLVYLNMSGCVQILPNGFHNLSEGCIGLNTIILNELPTLTDECLEAIMVKCRDLKSVSILDSPLLTDASISYLASAEKLQVLKLEGNSYVTDVSVKAICTCSKLRYLHLVGFERISDFSMKALVRCKELCVLNFADCFQISDFGVQYLIDGGSASMLREINFTNCMRITDLSLIKISQRCTSLAYANFSYCQSITDVGMEILASIQTLVSLDVSACTITDVGITFLANNPNFKDLLFSQCHSITDVGVEKLVPSEKNLEIFDLSDVNFLTDQSIKSLAYYCRRLRMFNISGCNLVSDEGLQFLCGVCQFLEQLDISGCTLLTDRTLHHIRKGCHSIKVVNLLNCTGITNNAVVKLRNKAKVRVLYTQEDSASFRRTYDD